MIIRRRWRIALTAIGVLLFAMAGPVAAAPRPSSSDPKVVIIVGPVGSLTGYYRSIAEQTATAASKLTSNVVRVYSPDATWERVKAALQGASIVVYLGHGNGWPSPYRNSLYPPSQDGFGLNPEAGAADAHQYFGEAQIASEIRLAPNALVVFSHLCYASGNSEPGLPEGTLAVAQQRVDNYAAGFFKAGAGAVIADAYLAPTYYVTSALRGRSTIDSIWRNAPNRNDHFLTFPSSRTKGAIAAMDPDNVSSGFHRSIVVMPELTSAGVLGGAIHRPRDVQPALEPSLANLGLTFGTPELTTPPTAGSTTTFLLPVAKDAVGLLPAKLMLATRWDLLDGSTTAAGSSPPTGPTTGGQTAGAAASAVPWAAPSPSAAPSASPGAPAGPGASGAPSASGSPGPDPSASPSPLPSATPVPEIPAASGSFPPQLVSAEQPGEVVAPVTAKHVKSGGLSVRVQVPATPGLYRLVPSIHDSDGLAFDAATQALIPALVVKVTGPQTAAYAVPTTASVGARQAFALQVKVSNLGQTAWGHAAAVMGISEPELVPALRATLVARWVSLAATQPDGAATANVSTTLPAGLAPGATATVSFNLTAPAAPGEYLVVFDIVDPVAGSLAALGVPPGIVRVTVGQ